MKVENEPTNHALALTKPAVIPEKLNDIGFRLILIPFFGISIPLITRMMDHGSMTQWEIKISYAYTIFISLLIWQGNRYLIFTLRSYFTWFNKPVKKILVLLLAISFYTLPLSALLLIGWFHIFAGGIVNWNIVFTSTLIILICVVFIVHVYETVFLVRDSESEIIRNDQLERARAEAELEALKNQIDPHFIFNSLNTLSHLIEENPAKARQFNDNLADVYRYILQNKATDLVLLREEMGFLQDYFSLLKIRFEKAVQLTISIDDALYDHYLIPSISLQVLAENAIKHNEFSDSVPLVILVTIKNDELKIHNSICRKPLRKTSSEIGLHNLNERYHLITGKRIAVRKTELAFEVSLPVLKIVA